MIIGRGRWSFHDYGDGVFGFFPASIPLSHGQMAVYIIISALADNEAVLAWKRASVLHDGGSI